MEIKSFMQKLSSHKGITEIDLVRKSVVKFNLEKEGSKDFLESIGIWSGLKKFSQPIKEINVLDRTDVNKIDFYHQNKNNNLGYIVKNNLIKKTIIKMLKSKKNIQFLINKNLNYLKKEEKILSFFTEKNIIKSKLLIAADGKNSFIRKCVNTPVYKKNYKHSALVINFRHEKNHHNIAHEIFYNSGPLAILPMPKDGKNFFLSSAIWSHDHNYTKNLFISGREVLISVLEEKVKKITGNINEIIDVQFFNLNAHLNSKFYDDRIIFLGDSAHSIHPIAGQGWNLGIRDIKKAARVIKKYNDLGLDFGCIEACKEYHNEAFYDSYFLFQITDKLNSVFLNDSLIIKNFRKKGFQIIQKLH